MLKWQKQWRICHPPLLYTNSMCLIFVVITFHLFRLCLDSVPPYRRQLQLDHSCDQKAVCQPGKRWDLPSYGSFCSLQTSLHSSSIICCCPCSCVCVSSSQGCSVWKPYVGFSGSTRRSRICRRRITSRPISTRVSLKWVSRRKRFSPDAACSWAADC